MSKQMRIVLEPEKFRPDIVNKLDSVIHNEKISENLEKGIYNYSLDVADKKNIIKKWDNQYFVILYIQKLKTILKIFLLMQA